MDKVKVFILLINFLLVECEDDLLRALLNHRARRRQVNVIGIDQFPPNGRRAEFHYDLQGTSGIIGAPGRASHLPEAEPIQPGHTLLRPALTMLKSAIKFPHRDMENGAGVLGNINSLGITWPGTNERVLYSGFRRIPGILRRISARRNSRRNSRRNLQRNYRRNSPNIYSRRSNSGSRRNLEEYVMVKPAYKPLRFDVSSVVLDNGRMTYSRPSSMYTQKSRNRNRNRRRRQKTLLLYYDGNEIVPYSLETENGKIDNRVGEYLAKSIHYINSISARKGLRMRLRIGKKLNNTEVDEDNTDDNRKLPYRDIHTRPKRNVLGPDLIQEKIESIKNRVADFFQSSPADRVINAASSIAKSLFL